MLEVQDLCKRFGSKTAVSHVSFTLDHPGVYGLIGTNGAGKTTTIRMILGLIPADSGSAEWNKAPVSRETVRFGYMPEERGLYLNTRVLDQLTYFGRLHGMSRRSAQKRAMQLLDYMDIAQAANIEPEKLSKGNQQKIQLAACLIHDPDLIFLDEPFSGLDPVNAEGLRAMIHDLVSQGKYIILSSHQMETVESYCENILLLHQGRTLLQGNLKEIKRSYGHTNLVISCNVDIAETAADYGMTLVEKRPGETEYRISGDEMASELLEHLISQGFYPTKYEIREPSLQEIFISKVSSAPLDPEREKRRGGRV